MTTPTPVASTASLPRPHIALAGLILLAMTACGGGGGNTGGSNSGGGTIPPPPPPPPVFENDDNIVGVLSGVPNRLDVLANDRPGETIVYVSHGTVGSDIAIEEATISYTSPGNYVGEDSFYYITENANGDRTRAEVVLRVDQVSRHNTPIIGAAPTPLATTSTDDGPYEVGYELYGGIEVITKSTTILEHNFNKTVRVDGIPSSLYFEGGPKQGHVINARLRAGVRYLISFNYSMRDERDITPPIIWSEYPQTVITDTYSVPLYDDLCTFYEDLLWGDFWACHTNQLGAERNVGQVFTPRVTDDYNIYIWSEVYVFDSKLVVVCDELPSFGCGYDVKIEELDDNTSDLFDASIAIGGSPVHGSIERRDDTDWFVLNAYATESTIVKVVAETDVHGEQLNFFDVHLWKNNRIIRSVSAMNGVAKIQYDAADDTALKLSIGSNANATGGYRIESVGGDIPSNTDTYANLRVGETVDGRINNGRDAGDWFRVYLDADTQYDATVTTSILDIENAFVGLRDSLGDAILGSKQTSDLSCNPGCEYTHLMSFSLPRSGYYYLTVGAPEPGQSGDYEIEIAERIGAVLDDDFAGDTTTIGRAESMVSSQGVLEQPGDADWFRFFTAFGGEQRTFFVDGAYVLNGLFEYPTISIVDASGTVVATGEIWTDGVQRIDLTSSGSADYFLTVAANGTNALPYTVHNGDGDPAGNRDTRSFVGVCSEVHQAIGRAADLDWYNIELLEGKSYAFEISGEDQGFTAATRPRVRLYTQEGEQIGSATAVDTSATLSVDITDSGQYFLEVNNDSGRIGGYRLAATDLADGACAE